MFFCFHNITLYCDCGLVKITMSNLRRFPLMIKDAALLIPVAHRCDRHEQSHREYGQGWHVYVNLPGKI